ncbi:tetratricopeptide repeat protein [Salmonirosea aquatica]|uniref:tetratricopeptide repeat protein n=1 Tax=Salmonirosea aquatica TaxID=2654236 RepID=UPI00357100AB
MLDAVALHWDPIALDDLRQITQLENPQLSPQLKRLYEVGWLDRLNAYEKKGQAYEISERFFNIWYLMRRSSRRQKKELLCLTKFLVTLYGEDLNQMGERLIQQGVTHRDHVSMQLAIADGVKDLELARKLREKSYKELFDLSRTDASILKDFDIPGKVLNERGKALIERMHESISAKAWPEAIIICEELIRLNPQSPAGWNLLGTINQKLRKYEEAEVAYRRATELNPTDVNPWNNLGTLYQDHLGNYAEAEAAYRRAIKLDETDAAPWFGLGTLYQDHLGNYAEAEAAYRRAIELDETDAAPWYGLGTLYQYQLGNYTEAEAAYRRAIELDETKAAPWFGLGTLYQYQLENYAEAEAAYRRAIELDETDAILWNNLGNLYQDYLRKYEEAEAAYLRASELDLNNESSRINLLFLYRDKMHLFDKAKMLYEAMDEPKDGKDSYWLNASLFALYDKNLGIAEKHLLQALHYTEGKLPPNTQDDWWRFAAVSINLGYGQAILEVLQQNGYDVILRPYFVAIQSLVAKDSTAFLNSIAAEVREVAADLAERIKRFM